MNNLKYLYFLISINFCFISNLNAQEFSERQRIEAITEEVSKKLSILQKLIKIIAEKKLSITEKSQAIEAALTLFKHEQVTIQVSSKVGGKVRIKTYLMEKYLHRLGTIKYDEVKITYDPYRISQVERIAEGRYSLKGKFYQQFLGRKSNGYTYSDYTIKEVEVEATEMLDMNGMRISVLFGNIIVLETN